MECPPRRERLYQVDNPKTILLVDVVEVDLVGSVLPVNVVEVHLAWSVSLAESVYIKSTILRASFALM